MATIQKILKVRISYHYSIKEFFNLTINKSIIFFSLFLFSCSNYLVQAEIVKPEQLKCGSTSNAVLLENSGKFTSNSDIFKNKLSLLDENINKDLFKEADKLSLLNFARHEVVNTEEVIEYIDKGNLRNFITDFPTPELIQRANTNKDVILLPHIGASTAQAEENCAVMAVNQITDFLETGNIKNSVNFPNVHLKRTTDHRISIINKNVPAMIGQIATALGELNLNIAEMTNVSRGEIAYNLIDIENEVDEASIAKLYQIENVINVRLIS